MAHAPPISDVQTDVQIVPVDCDSWLRNLLKLPTLCLVMVHGLGIYSLSGAPLPKLQGPRTVVQVTVSKRLKEGSYMSTLPRPLNPESDPRVKAVFDDIRASRGSDFINNLWHYLAFNPKLLEDTWRDVKAIMATPSSLDPVTKELIYAAVSIANSCDYCIHSHTAAARAKGMTEEQYAEFLSIVSLAGRTNHLLNAIKVPVDPEFDHT